MVGRHHRFDGHEFEQAPGVGDGQGILACCSPWNCKESDMSERLNWTEQRRKWKKLIWLKSCYHHWKEEQLLLLIIPRGDMLYLYPSNWTVTVWAGRGPLYKNVGQSLWEEVWGQVCIQHFSHFLVFKKGSTLDSVVNLITILKLDNVATSISKVVKYYKED